VTSHLDRALQAAKSSRGMQLTGEASSDLGRALAVSQNLRSKADYMIAGASKEDANDAIAAMDKILEFAGLRLISNAGENTDGRK
jgi:hypothetical protein